METSSSITSMVMYEDESVDVRQANGSELQVSACGSEFVLLRGTEGGGLHRVRQRTRFTVSAYRELIVAALAFRNKYASRPYLPEELIPAARKKGFFSTDSEVKWPEFTSCETEPGPGGETVIRSKESRAALTLWPSGEGFSVEFRCGLSRSPKQHLGARGSSRDLDGGPGRPQHPEDMYTSTTVAQDHSCTAYDPIWRYPLAIARHQWTTRLSRPTKAIAGETGDSAQAQFDLFSDGRKSCLPQALPLTCPSPHRHRWKSKDVLEDGDLPTELVKVMWCQGVTYRILSGAVSVIEVYPGDGSVIRSKGILNNYFTHHRPDPKSGRVKEVSYHLKSLPPDVVGEAYSIYSIVNRASRILTCHDQAKQSLKLPAMPSCLQETKEGRHFSKPSMLDENLCSPAPVDHHMNVTHSDRVAAELEKIKRFNFLLENSALQRGERGPVELMGCSAEEEACEAVTESSIAEALQKTARAIQDIDAVISTTTLKE